MELVVNYNVKLFGQGGDWMMIMKRLRNGVQMPRIELSVYGSI